MIELYFYTFFTLMVLCAVFFSEHPLGQSVLEIALWPSTLVVLAVGLPLVWFMMKRGYQVEVYKTEDLIGFEKFRTCRGFSFTYLRNEIYFTKQLTVKK